ncbi:hypothetical protein AHiyo8_35340 [Arthrobacter sp. Hiyo8]|nr:hypothetical protein AHiyo8_35340 [Arthrobacter sp. Hiyo8]
MHQSAHQQRRPAKGCVELRHDGAPEAMFDVGPSIFCETSHRPTPTPKKNSARAVPATDPAISEKAIAAPAEAASSPAARTVLAVPILPTTHPAEGSATRDPTAVHSRRVPICPDVRCRVWVTAGMRAAQLANTSPFMPKTRKVAIAAALTFGAVRVLVVIRSQLPRRDFQVGCVLRCLASGPSQ